MKMLLLQQKNWPLLTEKFGADIIAQVIPNENGEITFAALEAVIELNDTTEGAPSFAGNRGEGRFGGNQGADDENAIVSAEKLASLTEKFGANIIAQAVPNANGEITFAAIEAVIGQDDATKDTTNLEKLKFAQYHSFTQSAYNSSAFNRPSILLDATA